MPTINGKVCVVNGTPVDKVFSNGRQVYGTNLLLNSGDMSTGWVADGTSIFHLDGYLGVKATSGLRRIFENPTEDTNGKILSVSFDAMVPDDSANTDVIIYAGPLNAAMSTTISGNTFKHYKVENLKWISVNKAFSIQIKNIGDKINIRNVKLEYGSVATPWTPAPEDVGVK